MQKKNQLKIIGYWNGNEEEGYPDPQILVDNEWDIEERKLVIQYLDKGGFFCKYKGRSWCRFGCEGINMGSTEFTDGEFVWPEGFKHYLEVHNIKPPEEFIEKCKLNFTNDITGTHKDSIISNSWWIKNCKRIEIEKIRNFLGETFNDLKSFEDFFKKFTKDLNYQLEYIDFPVWMFIENYYGNLNTVWIEEDLWVNLNLPAIYNRFFSNEKAYKINTEILEFGVEDIEIHLKDIELKILVILHFERKDEKWKLAGVEDYSL